MHSHQADFMSLLWSLVICAGLRVANNSQDSFPGEVGAGTEQLHRTGSFY